MFFEELKQKLLATDLVLDNDWLDKYCLLLLTQSVLIYDSTKTNYHHAIPRTYYETRGLAVDNTADNVFILLYKDHVLAHYYLAMAAKESEFKYKMLYSIRFIIGSAKTMSEQDFLKKLPAAQHSYELLSKNFSTNNPSKNPENAKKISERRKGKIYIRKGNKSIVCDPAVLDEYLADGWECGRVGNWASSTKNKICIIYKGKNKFILPTELDHYLSLGATRGMSVPPTISNGNRGKMSKEARERQAAARRGKIAVHHKDTAKILYINKEDLESYLQQNYVLGTGTKNHPVLGKICICKDGKRKYINKEDLSIYLADGWVCRKKEVI